MTVAPLTRWVFVAIAGISALVALTRIVSPWDDANLFHRDFLQEHLIAQAIRDGDDPYKPLPALAQKYLPEQPPLPWKHPTPHPPPAALAFVPLGLLPFRIGRLLWLAIELGCLGGFIEMMSRWWGPGVSWKFKTLAALVSLSFGPVFSDLWNGQFSMLLLLILTAAWLRLRAGQDASGGVLLGLAIALKLTAWPTAIFLTLKRRWSAVVACAVLIVFANLLAAGLLGFETVRRYFTAVGPTVARSYRQYLENYSFWSVGSRFFGPERVEGLFGAVIQPLWPNATLEVLATYSLPALLLVLALTLAWRCRSFDSAYGILLVAGIPINPVVWDHSLLLTALPIGICLRRLAHGGASRTSIALVTVGIAISIPMTHAYLEAMVRTFATPDAHACMVVPFLPGLATYLPLVPIGIWTWLLWTTDAQAAMAVESDAGHGAIVARQSIVRSMTPDESQRHPGG